MKKILFVCYGNAFRSQMAEGFFNFHNKNPDFEGISAGTNPFGSVPESTTMLMKEKGIDLKSHSSKLLTKRMIEDAYRIYLMCKDKCPATPPEKTVEMFTEDPFGQSPEDMRRVRDEIERKIIGVIKELT